ncbi:acyl carrier protein [Paenibacillus sp. IITD108]|uniref:acyl carrier protein n=1 Tax=Paenibacillus sp. IITD108 TaxID=3116649 RepID=UPI002F42F6FC
MRNSIYKFIKNKLQDYGREVSENYKLVDDLNLDSLSILTLITDLEDEFSIEINDRLLLTVVEGTIEDIVKLVEKILQDSSSKEVSL